MNYHIGRMLIDENFDDKPFCPLCRIENTVETRLAEKYLGEAVMEDSARKEVNELGFCAHHFDVLYKMQSKLGLALQSHTRLKTLYKSINKPLTAKQAKKLSLLIDNKTCKCVICKYLDEHMTRYFKTVAQVYNGDESFKGKLLSVKGFCLNHYSKLNEYSSYAGKSIKEYLSDLYDVESKAVELNLDKLDAFCAHHDYRKTNEPLGENKSALPEVRRTLYGLKTE